MRFEEAALEMAMETWALLESYCPDREKDGYPELVNSQWEPVPNDVPASNSKTLNTHLQLLEAYTALLKVSHFGGVGDSLERLCMLFLEKFIDPVTGRLYPVFNINWQPVSYETVLGYETRCGSLLCEAARCTGNAALLKRAEKTAARLENQRH